MSQDCPNSEWKNRECYNCGYLQHIRRDFPEAGGHDPVANVYYRCNERGHIAQTALPCVLGSRREPCREL
ncbi:hypothetical protein HPB48_011308 [Haemaphysalis longicornis]|uniref:CCHC-type domain-containing protein n=1 Tax=Haemaphysalis longicornis TaxID=44386 RepID=A0A9J6GAE2_HAELO|nr:hypothetical protein HPB48_011308 [Haemaphysalis longicornis]